MPQFMQKYKITVAYDGTNYSGWQIQPHALSIQESIETVVSTIMQEPVKIIGSGRTDAGVHALGQAAHFSTTKELDTEKTFRSLNSLLPLDIRITSLTSVDSSFHAQYSAKCKTYQYHICTSATCSPFSYLYSCHTTQTLSLQRITAALPLILGIHDFTSFANSPSEGSAAKNPIRTLYTVNLKETDGGFCLEFTGNGFLYKMVRNMTGLLIDIGIGKRKKEEIEEIFRKRDRSFASAPAPAKGLFLTHVHY